MKKIRINELARELEVKPGIILDLLPELGVQEKKTHSSSIEEDTALALRERLAESGFLGSFPNQPNGHHDADEGEASGETASAESTYAEPAPPAVAATSTPESVSSPLPLSSASAGPQRFPLRV